jgi:hypothetical protein
MRPVDSPTTDTQRLRHERLFQRILLACAVLAVIGAVIVIASWVAGGTTITIR